MTTPFDLQMNMIFMDREDFMAGTTLDTDAVALFASRVRDSFFLHQLTPLFPMIQSFTHQPIPEFLGVAPDVPSANPDQICVTTILSLCPHRPEGRQAMDSMWILLHANPNTIGAIQSSEGLATIVQDEQIHMENQSSLLQIIQSGKWVQSRLHPIDHAPGSLPTPQGAPIVDDFEPSQFNRLMSFPHWGTEDPED